MVLLSHVDLATLSLAGAGDPRAASTAATSAAGNWGYTTRGRPPLRAHRA